MVAWHEVPGISKKKEPVPEGRCDYVFAHSLQRSCWQVLNSVMESTGPYAIILSLRDGSLLFTPFQALRARLLSSVPPGQ